MGHRIGSGFQHQRYFADMEEIVLDLFDTDNFADQLCNDARPVRTLRNRSTPSFERNPAASSGHHQGIDLNRAALAAAATLSGLDHILIEGDVGDPLGFWRV